MPTVLLATTNAHKAREIGAILTRYGIEVSVPSHLEAVEETGATFVENARLKAVAAARSARRPALADDSGISVEALGGEPGVRSARYAGENATDGDNNAKLLAAITSKGLVDPKAAFICCAVLAGADGRILAESIGRVEGVLRGPPRGSNGFGYDPLFHYTDREHPAPGVRFAELSAADKDLISHRGRAFRSMAAKILALLARDPKAFEPIG